ncbi:SDR family oxidoreductase [Myxococcota bacterium]|nr:SDR family oxidoreductase [Myxococcota bacterium]
MEDFEGKVGVVTGGGSGIGRSICLALAGAGAKVVVADIDGENASKVVEEIKAKGATGFAVPTDVTRSDSVEALANAVVEEMGGVDIVCNNAGVYLGGDLLDTTEDDWRFVLSVNLDGVFRVGQRFSKILREQGRGGHIVNTASIGGFLSHGGAVAYAASKYGVVAYSEALRVDLESHGIGVSTLCPGPIRTNLAGSDRLRDPGEQAGGKSQALWEFIREGMEPEEVGSIVLGGIRDNAAYIFTHDWSDAFAERFQRVLKDFERLR